MEERQPEPHLGVLPALLVGRPELPCVAERIGCQVDPPAVAHGNGITAIDPAPHREARRAEIAVHHVRRLGGGERRPPHAHLRQVDAMTPAEQRRPHAARAQHTLRLDGALLGDHRVDPAALHLDTAGGAILMDGSAAPTGRFRNRRRGLRGLRTPVTRRVQPADPFLGRARRHGARFGRAEDMAVDLLLACHVRPAFPARDIGRVLGHVKNAGAAESGFRTDLLVQRAPGLERVFDQRQFRPVTRGLAHPAPIAARLLAGDPAFLDERDRQALLCQKIGLHKHRRCRRQ